MGKAARAIIIEGDKILVMHRNKQGSQYYTLVGGRTNENETVEHALVREIKEETGLDVTKSRLVFFEEHSEPYNDQYIFLCDVAPNESVSIQDGSEEAFLNRMSVNVHTPVWAGTRNFSTLPFRTPQLQAAIVQALKKGFPKGAVKL